jgi:hypothetical protein
MSLVEDAANKEATETIVPFGKVEIITSNRPHCRFRGVGQDMK